MTSSVSTAGIIATYNQEAFVVEAIESLRDQVDELIVIDDASSDGTAGILREVEGQNIRVIHNETRSGVSRSFNRAIDSTDADVLVIQGGDDRSLPKRVERQVRALGDPNVIVCASRPVIINETGGVLPDWAAPEFFPPDPSVDSLGYLYSVGNMICAPSVSLRREDYLGAGGFHVGLDHLQDYYLWLKLAERGDFVFLREPVVQYRKHSSNLSRENMGIDSPRRRRERAESDYVLNDFLASASLETLLRLAPWSQLDAGQFAALSRDEQAALLQLNHSDRLLVRRGFAFVLATLAEPDGDRILDRMGLSRADLTALAVRADHDNAGDVARAIAVRKGYDRLSSQQKSRGRRPW